MMYQYDVMLKNGETISGFIKGDTPEQANENLESFLSDGTTVILPNVDGFPFGWIKSKQDHITDWRIH